MLDFLLTLTFFQRNRILNSINNKSERKEDTSNENISKSNNKNKNKNNIKLKQKLHTDSMLCCPSGNCMIH